MPVGRTGRKGIACYINQCNNHSPRQEGDGPEGGSTPPARQPDGLPGGVVLRGAAAVCQL